MLPSGKESLWYFILETESFTGRGVSVQVTSTAHVRNMQCPCYDSTKTDRDRYPILSTENKVSIREQLHGRVRCWKLSLHRLVYDEADVQQLPYVSRRL